MGRTPNALEYREIVAIDGWYEKTTVILKSGKNIGKGKPVGVIHYADGRTERRKVGNSSITFSEKIRARDAAAFGPMCRYCGVREADTVDHVKPWAAVGDYLNAANAAAACKPCNTSFRDEEYFGTKTPAKVAQILRENRTFGK